ncbi:MAG: HAD family hydrolase [Verrucomicrobiaceae bacterium]|nr:MAG: HAD family hydrolase [Verrucomicrobiaceae bacterium]
MPAREIIIGFDADDTLWHNQPIFERAYDRFRELLSRYHEPHPAGEVLVATEMKNLPLYGYGIKGFTLSAIETAITLSNGKISSGELRQLLDAARDMLEHPVDLLDGVAETLAALAADHRMIVITKGDLRDQERKLERSGLAGYFRHIEVVSEKESSSYGKILGRHGIPPENFLMVGNSLRSDILPVLAIGGAGAYLPYHITLIGEHAEEPVEFLDRFFKLGQMSDLPEIIRQLTL